MFFLNPLVIAGIVIFAIIFLVGVTFWIVFGIKKFKWALITSIVLSALFIITGGMFSLRMVSAKVVSGGRPLDRFTRIERAVDITKFDMFRQRGVFGLRKLPGDRRLEIKFEGIEKEDLEQLREHWDEIESITINVDISVEYKEE